MTKNLELNAGDDFIVALDISASMQAQDCPGGVSRIQYLLESLKVFANEAFKYDTDGVSFYAFGAQLHAFPDLTPADFDAKLAGLTGKLEGMTRTDLAIAAAYAEHKARDNEQTFLLLFTDGDPSDPAAVEKAIIDITNEVSDPGEFRIAFVTVGQRPPSLDAWLTALDDNLKNKGAKHDIVDVKRLEEVDFYSAISGALTD